METVAGYRLVRVLGEGDRAQVWLGHAPGGDVAAIKVYRGHILIDDVSREIRALVATRSRHVIDLMDVGTDTDGAPCLILPRLPGPSLVQLLGRRTALHPGELVTMLAPVVSTVAGLQRAGVAHRALSTRSVLLDDVGAPMLIGFGRAELLAGLDKTRELSPARIADDALLSADRDALFAMVDAVAARADVAEPLSRWIADHSRDDDVLPALVQQLHSLSPARPLRSEDEPVHVAFPVRHVPVVTASERAGETGTRNRRLGGALARAMERGPAAAIGPRLAEIIRSVRRPVWITGVAGLIALVIGFAVIPAISGPVTPAASTADSAAGSTSTPPPPPAGGATVSPRTSAPPRSDEDDPVEQTRHVLVQRMHCLNLNSARCLDSVDQAGSSALAEDREKVTEPGRAPEVPDRLTLVERLGDTAIVGVGEPSPDGGYAVSVLMVKTDLGWRLRDTITGVVP